MANLNEERETYNFTNAWTINGIIIFAIIVGIVQFMVQGKLYACFNFTGVAPLILYFAMKFKIIFSTRFFLYDSFNFQCLPSQDKFLK